MGTADDEANCALWGNVVSSCPITSGTFTDSRDSKSYKWVKIGTQTWMAENMSYNASGSKCYNNSETNCVKYGKMYDWTTAKTVCPSGWHLPSGAEWDYLFHYVDGSGSVSSDYDSPTAGKYLKATNGWNNSGNGTDNYGFSALPGGLGNSSFGTFGSAGELGGWWSSDRYDSDNLGTSFFYYRFMRYNDGNAGLRSDEGGVYLLSVRCLKN